MNNNGHTPRRRRRVVDNSTTALAQMNHYCASHPGGSPSAVRRPQLFFRGDLWIAPLGRSLKEGIVGIGPNVLGSASRVRRGILLSCDRLTRDSNTQGQASRAALPASLLVVLLSSILSGW